MTGSSHQPTNMFATDLYAPFRTLLRLLDGKTVGDMPALLRERMLAAGFASDRLLLSIPMVEIFECFDEEANLGRGATNPVQSILPTLKNLESLLDEGWSR
jgi:hypothetical protein